MVIGIMIIIKRKNRQGRVREKRRKGRTRMHAHTQIRTSTYMHTQRHTHAYAQSSTNLERTIEQLKAVHLSDSFLSRLLVSELDETVALVLTRFRVLRASTGTTHDKAKTN